MLSSVIIRAAWREERSRGWPLILFLLGALFLSWKEGFVRGDAPHNGIFFGYAIALAVALPVFFAGLSQPAATRVHCAIVGALIACAGLGGVPAPRFPTLIKKFTTKVPWLISPSRTASTFAEKLRIEEQRFALPNVQALVGRPSIDVFGFEQAIALLNGLNYRPPPVYQAYQACTRDLVHLNLSFYQSGRAPEFVLFKLQTIDGRFPTLDNAPVLRELLRRYEFVIEEKGYLLLRQKAALARESAPMRPIAAGEFTVGETLTIPNAPDAIWCELDLRENILGRLTRFVWGQHPLFLRVIPLDVSTPGGEYRIIPSVARGGFLLSPLVRNNEQFRELLMQNPIDPTARIKGFYIQSNRVTRWLMRPRIKFAIYGLP